MKQSHAQQPPSTRILESTLAGTWYPAMAGELDRLIESHLDKIPHSDEHAPPNVLILPHAGYAYSLRTALAGIKWIVDAPFDRVVLLAPAHRVAMRNQFVAPRADAVSTPYGTIPIDIPAIAAVSRPFPVTLDDEVHANEHSAQIQYPLLQYALKTFTLAPFIVGEMDRAALDRAAAALRPILTDHTLLVISSDFTHYGPDFGYAPHNTDVRANVEAIDREAAERIRQADREGFLNLLDTTGATICGRNPIAVLLTLLPAGAEIAPLHYATSSDESGDFSRFVCYMSLGGRVRWPATADTEKK